MKSKRLVVSLGGNALGYEPSEQLLRVKQVADIIVELIKDGHEILIAHGNGPQVGLVNNAFEYANNNGKVPMMPFAECGAMTQGYIGYHLQQSIHNKLKENNIDKDCLTVVSQVLVDENDDAFKNPSKPIGTFYDEETANRLAKETGYTYIEDAGRGYRRVVASPMPIDIIEKKAIEQLMKDNIVICGGGGGIPVINTADGLQGIAAVIDKDRTSSLLADLVDVDILMILTAVDNVYINFNLENQTKLEEIDVQTIKTYLESGHFAKGSMYPKVEACLSFLNKEGRSAIITSLDNALDALRNNTGTHIK